MVGFLHKARLQMNCSGQVGLCIVERRRSFVCGSSEGFNGVFSLNAEYWMVGG